MHAHVIRDSVETDRHDHVCLQFPNAATGSLFTNDACFGLSRPSERVSWCVSTLFSPVFFSSTPQQPHRFLCCILCGRTCAYSDTSRSPYREWTRHVHVNSCKTIMSHPFPGVFPDCSGTLEPCMSVLAQYTSLLSSENLSLTILSLLHVPGKRSTSHCSTLMSPGVFNPSVISHLSLNMAAESDRFNLSESFSQKTLEKTTT